MSVGKKVKFYRERSGFSQSELAERANVSLRTIQRVENGENIPRGYTLTVLSQALALDIEELTTSDENPSTVNDDQSKVQYINLAALTFVVIPFGNVIFPLFLWQKYKSSQQVDQAGRRIINFQIAWTLVASLLLIVTPFFQAFILNTDAPVIIMILVALYVFNIFMILKSAGAIRKGNFDMLKSFFQLL